MTPPDEARVIADPVFTNRRDLTAWAQQRWRFPDPRPDARVRALTDIRRVTIAHLHLPVEEPHHAK